MRYLTLHEVLELHRSIIAQSGGSLGVLNLGALESALAQPRMTFGGEDLYASAVDKALALGLFAHPESSVCRRQQAHRTRCNMEIFLVLKGFEIEASVDEQERVILGWRPGRSIALRFRVGFTRMLWRNLKVRKANFLLQAK